ncbi:MAG: LamG domain-containing protein [Myxococcota bacterium]
MRWPSSFGVALLALTSCGDDGGASGDGSSGATGQPGTDESSASSTNGGLSTGSTGAADTTGPSADSTSGGAATTSGDDSSSGGGEFNGFSVELDGVAAFVDLGTRDAVFGADPSAWSVSLWVRLSEIPAGDELSGDGIFSVAGGAGFGSGPDLLWSTELDDPSIAFYPPGVVGGIRAVPADPTGWTHVVAVFDPMAANNHARLYLDGALGVEADAMGGDFDAAGNVWVGKYLNDNFVTAGLFDEVAVWNVALSGEAVAAIYNAGAPTDLAMASGAYDAQDALTGYWRMGDDNGGAGTDVADVTANSDGTLESGATFSTDVP